MQSSLIGITLMDKIENQTAAHSGTDVSRWQEQPRTFLIEYNTENETINIVPDESLNLRIRSDTGTNESQVMSMLFADAVGFSKLSDREVKLFVQHFLGRVSKCISKYVPDAALSPDLWSSTAIRVRET